MAQVEISKYLAMLPGLLMAPKGFIWSTYDKEADVLYINFKKPAQATDSEMTDDDVIIRYKGREVVGLTVLHASERSDDSSFTSHVKEPSGSYKKASAKRTIKR